ncbi:MAG TPA: AAA family ATPase [Phycisphaerae bacterium]|nr:AAA family ATPase [Phycisphaerae bacterium]
MRLKSFSVQKYRSITAAKKIPLGKTTILVGPNNEGKSNILRALVTAMNILVRERHTRIGYRGSRAIRMYMGPPGGYHWETDFPVALQDRTPNGQTSMTLEFELTPDEINDFRETIRSRLTGTLPIRITIGPAEAKVEVAKQGPGAAALSKKSEQIAQFVTDRIDFQHIEAIRTASSAEKVVSNMVARELDQLEDNADYRGALARLDELQQPMLDTLSGSVQKTLKQFLHDVRSVSISVSSDARYRAVRRACEIVVDDGTPTLLKYKGDGAQSLAALGLIRHATERGAKGKGLVIAIEEPESHLHPKAIHELKQVVDELSDRHQVLITTHNPLFVDRRNIRNNIIVSNNRAKPAQSVEQVRDVLGVRASDNLRHAEIVLLVEGEDDRTALRSILSHKSQILGDALSQGTLAIDTLGGGSNLAYKVSSVRDAICLCHAFLDDDKAGRDAFEKARLEGLVADAEVNFCIREGLNETEIEDLYDTSVYETLLQNKYGVSIKSPKFKGKKKWTDRIKACFRHCGKLWDHRVEVEVKSLVAQAVAKDPANALCPHHAATLDALIQVLEARVKSKEKAQEEPALERE